MRDDGTISVRFFGSLHELRHEQGLPVSDEIPVPSQGLAAREIARRLGVPLDRVEGVFCNRIVRDLDHVVQPGDRIAFVPKGTPGPHRYFLGLYEAGRHEGEDDR